MPFWPEPHGEGSPDAQLLGLSGMVVGETAEPLQLMLMEDQDSCQERHRVHS